jgi:hypothetical protein
MESTGEKFKVIAPYQPVHGDEIKLVIGDRIIVLHTYDDGTFSAVN